MTENVTIDISTNVADKWKSHIINIILILLTLCLWAKQLCLVI